MKTLTRQWGGQKHVELIERRRRREATLTGNICQCLFILQRDENVVLNAQKILQSLVGGAQVFPEDVLSGQLVLKDLLLEL